MLNFSHKICFVNYRRKEVKKSYVLSAELNESLKQELHDSQNKLERMDKKVELFQNREVRVQSMLRECNNNESRANELEGEVQRLQAKCV